MITFITFGNEKYYNSLKRIKNEAHKMDIFDNILIFTDNTLKNRCPVFWNKHSRFILNNSRGYGYWLWKSFLILKTLESINENDILLYTDSGCTLNLSGIIKLNDYFNIVKKCDSGILSFKTKFYENQYTKMDLFEYLKMNDDNVINSNHLMATVLILRKCENTVKFVNEWYETCCKYNLLDDTHSLLLNTSSFIEHRHDQSIYSLLAKKYGTKILDDETWFDDFNKNGKKYPIWATRLT